MNIIKEKIDFDVWTLPMLLSLSGDLNIVRQKLLVTSICCNNFSQKVIEVCVWLKLKPQRIENPRYSWRGKFNCLEMYSGERRIFMVHQANMSVKKARNFRKNAREFFIAKHFFKTNQKCERKIETFLGELEALTGRPKFNFELGVGLRKQISWDSLNRMGDNTCHSWRGKFKRKMLEN